MKLAFSDRRAWLAHLTEIGRGHGFFERLGRRHSALYVQEGGTLVVSFDEASRVYGRTQDGLPLGFDAVQTREWSLLNIMCAGETWFRDPALYAFFDRLVDEDFFDSFDQVIFLGCGPMCGYAAAAYAVVAPGAKVIAISPVASLDREAAAFDTRFPLSRRSNFTDRYGYAPAMIEGTSQCTVIYDPYETLDAAHAALFRGPNVQRLPVRWGGPDLAEMIIAQGALDRILHVASRNRLKPRRFSQLTRRARRADPDRLHRMMIRADDTGHPALAAKIAAHARRVTDDPRFAAPASEPADLA